MIVKIEHEGDRVEIASMLTQLVMETPFEEDVTVNGTLKFDGDVVEAELFGIVEYAKEETRRKKD